MSKAATTIKVAPHTHARLQQVARDEDRSMGDVITDLVDRYERERFWQGVASDLQQFQSDTAAYRRYQDEFATWENQTTASLADEPEGNA